MRNVSLRGNLDVRPGPLVESLVNPTVSLTFHLAPQSLSLSLAYPVLSPPTVASTPPLTLCRSDVGLSDTFNGNGDFHEHYHIARWQRNGAPRGVW